VLPELLKDFQVIHICGKGHLDSTLEGTTGYRQFEYVDEELPDLLAAADLVISRAGANAIFELLALRKPNLLIPLPKGASRGDQILNAKSFARQGFSKVLMEEDLNDSTLLEEVRELYRDRREFISTMENSQLKDSVSEIMELIRSVERYQD
jgi:UDP-N-acetylglucosamine--N-acetylmuramyl-(pentapeptide) pyrophosphoryl-undecaprenol N-acetylglucosamine transferase